MGMGWNTEHVYTHRCTQQMWHISMILLGRNELDLYYSYHSYHTGMAYVGQPWAAGWEPQRMCTCHYKCIVYPVHAHTLRMRVTLTYIHTCHPRLRHIANSCYWWIHRQVNESNIGHYIQLVQCNLDYPDIIYSAPELSGPSRLK